MAEIQPCTPSIIWRRFSFFQCIHLHLYAACGQPSRFLSAQTPFSDLMLLIGPSRSKRFICPLATAEAQEFFWPSPWEATHRRWLQRSVQILYFQTFLQTPPLAEIDLEHLSFRASSQSRVADLTSHWEQLFTCSLERLSWSEWPPPCETTGVLLTDGRAPALHGGLLHQTTTEVILTSISINYSHSYAGLQKKKQLDCISKVVLDQHAFCTSRIESSCFIPQLSSTNFCRRQNPV